MKLNQNEKLLGVPHTPTERVYLNSYKELKSRYGEAVTHDTSLAKTASGDLVDLKTLVTAPKPEFDELVLTTPTHWIYAGLIPDEAFNPLESDGEGQIFRHDNHAERNSFYRALGLDNSGERELNDMSVIAELAKAAVEKVQADEALLKLLDEGLKEQGVHATKEKICQKLKEAILECNWWDAEDRVAQVFFNCRYVWHLDDETRDATYEIFDLLSEDAANQAWDRAMEANALGEKYALLLDKYEHGNVMYSIAGTRQTEAWDTSKKAAVWVPDPIALENIKSIALRNAFEFFKVKVVVTDDARTYSYTVDEGETWSEPAESVEAVIDQAIAANINGFAEKWSGVFTKVLCDYAATVVEQYSDYLNGNAYRVLAYRIDRSTYECTDEAEEYSILGHDPAYAELVNTIVSIARSLT